MPPFFKIPFNFGQNSNQDDKKNLPTKESDSLAPQIILLSDYQPLTNKPIKLWTSDNFIDKTIYSSLNNSGRYVDAQVQSRCLDYVSYQLMSDSVSQDSKNKIKQQNSAAQNAVVEANQIKDSIVEVLVANNKVKEAFNLKKSNDALYSSVDPNGKLSPKVLSTKIWLQFLSNLKANFQLIQVKPKFFSNVSVKDTTYYDDASVFDFSLFNQNEGLKESQKDNIFHFSSPKEFGAEDANNRVFPILDNFVGFFPSFPINAQLTFQSTYFYASKYYKLDAIKNIFQNRTKVFGLLQLEIALSKNFEISKNQLLESLLSSLNTNFGNSIVDNLYSIFRNSDLELVISNLDSGGKLPAGVNPTLNFENDFINVPNLKITPGTETFDKLLASVNSAGNVDMAEYDILKNKLFSARKSVVDIKSLLQNSNDSFFTQDILMKIMKEIHDIIVEEGIDLNYESGRNNLTDFFASHNSESAAVDIFKFCAEFVDDVNGLDQKFDLFAAIYAYATNPNSPDVLTNLAKILNIKFTDVKGNPEEIKKFDNVQGLEQGWENYVLDKASQKKGKKVDYENESFADFQKNQGGLYSDLTTKSWELLLIIVKSRIFSKVSNLMYSLLSEISLATDFNNLTKYSGYPDGFIAYTVFNFILSIFKNNNFTAIKSLVTAYNESGTPNLGNSVTFKYEVIEKFNILLDKIDFILKNMKDFESTLFGDKSKVGGKPGVLKFISSKFFELGLSSTEVFDEGQVRLMSSRVDDCLKKFQGQNTIKLLEDSVITTRSAETLVFNIDQMLTSNPMFDPIDKTFSMDDFRIITVGIPKGFSRIIKSKSSFTSPQQASDVPTKRSQVIEIAVQQTNELFPLLKFKPIKFLFDLAVLPHQSENQPSSPEDLNFKDLSTFTNNSLVLKGVGLDQYKFLSVEQRKNLFRTHQMSYALSLYLNLFTGLEVNEQSFFSEELLNLLKDQNSFIKNLLDSEATNLSNFYLQTESFKSSLTNMTDVQGIKRFLLSNRKFDRIINLIVPKNFFIDTSDALSAKSTFVLLSKNKLSSGFSSDYFLSKDIQSIPEYQVYINYNFTENFNL